ncbi:unnamed protein product [Arabidopsis halleri]
MDGDMEALTPDSDLDMAAADDDAVKELDEMKKRLKEMEDEAAALREMQVKVEKEMAAQDPASIAANQAGKEEVDARSVFVGNSFFYRRSSVVAIDIDPVKVELAMNNAMVYGVANRVDFIIGDFIQLAPSLKGDVVFLSPPWGGPMYRDVESYKLDMLQPRDGYSLFQCSVHYA